MGTHPTRVVAPHGSPHGLGIRGFGGELGGCGRQPEAAGEHPAGEQMTERVNMATAAHAMDAQDGGTAMRNPAVRHAHTLHDDPAISLS